MVRLSKRKNYIYSVLSSFSGTIVSSLIGLVAVPISLNYWQVGKYGLWSLLSSVLVYLSMSNLGVNASASTLMAKNPKVQSKILILKRAFVILLISTLVALVSFVLLNLFHRDWIQVLGDIPKDMKKEAFETCLVMGIFFFINLPFSLTVSVFQGFQKVYIVNIFSVISSITNFISLIIVIAIHGSLVTYAVVSGAAAFVVNVARLIFMLIMIRHESSDKDALAKGDLCTDDSKDCSYRHVFITGIRFFISGIAAMVVWNTDNLVISNFLGIDSVTPYSITFKLYQILFNCIFIVNTSLLAIMAKEFGENNWEWINKVYRSALVVAAMLGGLTLLGGVLFMKDIIFLWAGERGYAGLFTVVALGGYSYLLSIVNLNSGIINSFNYIKYMPIVGWIEAGVNLGMSIVLLKPFGIGGVALGTFLGSLLGPALLLPRIIEKSSDGKIIQDSKFVVKHLVFVLLPLFAVSICLQLFLQKPLFRVSLGFLVIVCYVCLSFKVIPNDVKAYLGKNTREILQGIRKKSA